MECAPVKRVRKGEGGGEIKKREREREGLMHHFGPGRI